jgi:hypothetical protein
MYGLPHFMLAKGYHLGLGKFRGFDIRAPLPGKFIVFGK